MRAILLRHLIISSLLQKTFDCLIDSFIEKKIGITEHFVSDTLAGHLRDHLISLHKEKLLLTGGTGNEHKLAHNTLLRNDIIYWLDRKHDNPYENEFLALMDRFVSHLNDTCYTGITGYEFHFALYEEGAFYRRHLDQFQNDDRRQFSMIVYLNGHWMEGDGGELMIYQTGNDCSITPTNGKGVFFKSSELAHEVLVTSKPRMSITGWLKRERL